jgi:thymidylate synthase
MVGIDEQYVALGKQLLEQELRPSRVGATRGCWAPAPLVCDLRASFPLLQCKKVAWRMVIGELLWMIDGGTNAWDLHKPEYGSSHIWDGDAIAYRERLVKSGAEGPSFGDGDLGRVYGAQWCNWNGETNQLKEVVTLLRKEPSSRRGVVTAFNPSDSGDLTSALPPCHMMFQVGRRGRQTDVSMVQRSADWMIGVPYNIASYATMTCMLASLFGDVPGTYTHLFSGDVHIYEAHEKVVRSMIGDYDGRENGRVDLELRIVPGNRTWLTDFKLDDFEVVRKSDGVSYDSLGVPVYRAKVQTVAVKDT